MILGTETQIVSEFAKLKQRQYYLNKRLKLGKVPDRDIFGLTSRDRKIIELTAKGWRSKEISSFFGDMSEDTVNQNRYRLMKKFHCKNPAHLVSACYDKGILRVTGPGRD